MSVIITAKITCNGCGAEIIGDKQTRTSQGATAYWSALMKAKRARWLILTRYGAAIHLCQLCADGQPATPKCSHEH